MARHPSAIVIGLARGAKMYLTGGLSEKSVIFADTNIFACHDRGAPLADDDLADTDLLPVGTLYPEVFRIGIAEIVCCSSCFCMGHK